MALGADSRRARSWQPASHSGKSTTNWPGRCSVRPASGRGLAGRWPRGPPWSAGRWRVAERRERRRLHCADAPRDHLQSASPNSTRATPVDQEQRPRGPPPLCGRNHGSSHSNRYARSCAGDDRGLRRSRAPAFGRVAPGRRPATCNGRRQGAGDAPFSELAAWWGARCGPRGTSAGTADASGPTHETRPCGRWQSMSDLLFVLLTIGFFALAWGYVVALDRL